MDKDEHETQDGQEDPAATSSLLEDAVESVESSSTEEDEAMD